MKTSLYELANNSVCNLRRGHDLYTKKAISEDIIGPSKLAKEVIKDFLTGQITWQEGCKKVEDYFSQSGAPTNATKRIKTKEMQETLLRYIQAESRKPILPQGQELNLFGAELTVTPDLLFLNGNNIEVVQLRYSKPKLAKKARKGSMKIAIEDSMDLYALLQFGRNLIQNGKTASVTASMYYLRPEARKTQFAFFEEESDQVASITDIYSTQSGIETARDIEMQKKFLAFQTGKEVECNPNTCKNCDFYDLCSFKKAPIAILSETKTKTIGKINLTKDQAAAIDFDRGVTRINAGAGAGKTLTVALRTIELLKKGVSPKEICLLTFTNTGAMEMRERIQAYNDEFGTGEDLSEMIISTFNSFGDSIIKENYKTLGFDMSPILIDDIEKAAIITSILKEEEIDGMDFRNYKMKTKSVKGALYMAKRIFEIMKENNLDEFQVSAIKSLLDYESRFISDAAIAEVAELYCDYTYKLREQNLIEYSDQELMVFELIRKIPDLFQRMGIAHIVVDEYQDSNLRQLNFIKLMMNTSHFQSLMVVGDDSQAIFSFRNTSPDYIIHFFNYIGVQGQDFFLLENHRSTPEIINFANSLNDLNKNKVIKSLIPTRPSGKPVVARAFDKDAEETTYIVDKIKEKIKNGTRPEDIAYIAQSKNELLKMASLLTEEGIASVLLNPEPYMDNSKVRAALDLVKAYQDPNATNSILNFMNCLEEGALLKRYDDKQIEAAIVAYTEYFVKVKALPALQCKQEMFGLLAKLGIEDEIYASFLETIGRKPTMQQVVVYCQNFEDYGQDAAVKRQCNYPGVVLTTAHSSKGLEWPVVFNSISKYYTPGTAYRADSREETRRLFFVSATRARDELYITGKKIAFGNKDGEAAVYNEYLVEAFNILGLSLG